MLLRSLALLCLVPAIASAEDESPAPANATISISPVHLLGPIVEMTGEINTQHGFGIGIIAGIGQLTDEDTDTTISIAEIGTSIRYYPIGTFRHGLQLGAEALYVHGSTDQQMTTIRAAAEGLSIGPFVGYKWTANYGLTIESQLGAAFIVVRDADNTADSESTASVLLNLNVGYTF